MNNYLKKRNGWTIVELMVFIIIVVILGSLAFPKIRRLSARAQEARIKSNMLTLKIAAENFGSMAHGLYPKDPANSVQEVLSDLGIASNNQMRIADNCPATVFDVNSGAGTALLPGENTFVNPVLFNGNCLDRHNIVPPFQPISPYSSGQGTVYWCVLLSPWTYATQTYSIIGCGLSSLLVVTFHSEYYEI
jgi:type II secretory pathway pseudopilin PulG